MTKQKAIETFKQINNGLLKEKDKGKIRLAWTYFVASLHRDGMITEKQCRTWTNPSFCK